MKRNQELLCPRCGALLLRTPKYNEEGTIFKGNRISCSKCGIRAFEAVNNSGWKLSLRLRTKQYLNFQKVAEGFRQELEKGFSEVLEEPTRFFPLTAISLAYLLNLRAITIKHQISVYELCELIVKIRRPYGAGSITQRFNMALNRFGGMDLFNKLEAAIQAKYPHGEQHRGAATEEQENQIYAAMPAKGGDSGDYLGELKRLKAVRRILSKAATTRNYRGNPWA